MRSQSIWDQKAAQGDYKGAFLAFIQYRRGATFVELQNILSPYIPVYGDLAIYREPYENAIFWAGVSIELAKLYGALMSEHLIYVRTTSPYTYLADGKVLTLPLATLLEADYQEPHWYPVALYPMDEAARRKFAGRDEVTEQGSIFMSSNEWLS